jgi:hypothetical protein
MTDYRRKRLFPENHDVAVFTTSHIIRDRLPILYVVHDTDDGAWQFHHAGQVREKDAMVVSLEEIVELDPSIRELADLPPGWTASRISIKSPWKRHRDS